EPDDKEIGHSSRENIVLGGRGSNLTRPNARPHHPSIHMDDLVHRGLDRVVLTP
ncbi:unnamed protein product, partial [Musa acuminata subsp. burmannicoides]